MAKEYILKEELMGILKNKAEAWGELQGKQQDVTTENFVENAVLIYTWIIGEVEGIQTREMG